MRKRFIIIAAIVGVLVLGVLIGWFAQVAWLHVKSSSVTVLSNQIRANPPQYQLINPPLYSETAKSTAPAFTALASELNAYVSSTTKNNEAQSVSVYFRQLNTSQWTGVDENDTYTPASMLKVVTMMAVLQLAQTNPSILTEQLPYIVSSSTPFTEYYASDDGLKTGEYSAQDLIGDMIRYSDNTALYALLSDNRINDEFTNVYNLYRLPTISATDTSDYMSPKSYASVFISLYNSSLFPWDLSEQVLNLLTQTTFTEGIVAGVPAGTVVAHKFGESSDMDANGNIIDRQLHDCGIVYYPGNPYLLCVMTRGQNYPALAGVISGVSNLVYNYVNGKPF